MDLPAVLRDAFPAGKPIYALSPHIDDVIWSAGGFLHALAQQGYDITLVSMFSHTIYVYDEIRSPIEATTIRKAEDYTAARMAEFKDVIFLDFPDGCLRDRPTSQVLDPTYETPPYLLDLIHNSLKKLIPSDATLLIPAGFGGHMDHLTARRAGVLLEGRKVIYADLPYATREHTGEEALAFLDNGWQESKLNLPEEIIKDHMNLFWQYPSQTSQAVADEIKVYFKQGMRIWVLDD